MKYISMLFVFSLFACSKPEKEEKDNRELPHELRFTTFNLDDFSHIQVNCDIGRLKITMRQYDYHKLEVHKSYQKYVRFNVVNDTLFIETLNTPRDAKKEGIAKNINFYAPDYKSISANASRITAEHLVLDKLKVNNLSTSFRLYDSVVKDLTIENNGTSSILLDPNNVADKLYIKCNENSVVNSMAFVERNFTIEAKSLKNIQWKNVPPNAFHWKK